MYLVASRHTILGVELVYVLMPLLAIPVERAGPKDILLLCPSDWYGVFRALSILVPCLGDWMRCSVGVTIRMVKRLHLKGDGGA